jgi:hypothetical protein
VGFVSCQDFEFGEMGEASPCVWGAIGVLQSSRVLHEADTQFVFVDEALTDEALCRTAI